MHGLLVALKTVATRARLAAGRERRDIQHTARVDKTTIHRFEDPTNPAWPDKLPVLMTAYSRETGRPLIDLWQDALDQWQENEGTESPQRTGVGPTPGGPFRPAPAAPPTAGTRRARRQRQAGRQDRPS